MSLVTLAEALLHLRAESGAEDTLIQALLNAAELSTVAWLNRRVYADSGSLAAAVGAAPAALTAATAAYAAAFAAAELIDDETESDIALTAAERAYAAAQTVAKQTNAGLVMNDAIKAAILLTVGHLYANREATGSQNVVELPMGVQWLLQPLKAYP